MASFFNKSFDEQVKCIISTGDLKVLQLFIGIRNPIGLLQYYSSFISTKINIMDIRLHGEYKVQKRCLKHYTNALREDKYQSKNGKITGSMNSNLSPMLISNVSEELKKELLTKILLPITQDKTVDSICNTDYMYDSNTDQELVNFTHNTEINSLCSMDREQVGEMCDAFVNKSIILLTGIIGKYPYGTREQKMHIDDELRKLRQKILDQESEIIKYKAALRQIQNRSFLRDWFTELVRSVKKDITDNSSHIFHEYFSNDVTDPDAFIENLKDQFIVEVISRLLKEILGDNCSKEQFNDLLDILKDHLEDNTKFHYESFVENTRVALKKEIDKCDDTLKGILELMILEINPGKIIKIEQSVLDHILLEAVSQGKQDCALLLICNGANINLEREMEDKSKIKVNETLCKHTLEKSGFSVIQELYSTMPSIKASLRLHQNIQGFSQFVVKEDSILDENCEQFTINNILSLKEIRDTFPDNSMIKMAADFLTECDEQKSRLTETSLQKEQSLGDRENELNAKKKTYTTVSWKTAAILPLCALPFFNLTFFAGCLAVYIIGASYDIGRPWNARRTAENELEIAQEDLGRATKMFNIFLEGLQASTVAGNDVFKERCKEIEKEIEIFQKSEEKWVNFSRVLKAFEKAQEAGTNNNSCFCTESVKFSKFAEDIIHNRMRYTDALMYGPPGSNSSDQTGFKCNIEEEVNRKRVEGKKERICEKKVNTSVEKYSSLFSKVQFGEISQRELQIERERTKQRNKNTRTKPKEGAA